MWLVSGKGGMGGGEWQCQGVGRLWVRLRLCWGCSGLPKGRCGKQEAGVGSRNSKNPGFPECMPGMVSQAAGSVISAVCTFPG